MNINVANAAILLKNWWDLPDRMILRNVLRVDRRSVKSYFPLSLQISGKNHPRQAPLIVAAVVAAASHEVKLMNPPLAEE